MFAYVDTGIADGIQLDAAGNVYAGTGDGVQVGHAPKIWPGCPQTPAIGLEQRRDTPRQILPGDCLREPRIRWGWAPGDHGRDCDILRGDCGQGEQTIVPLNDR